MLEVHACIRILLLLCAGTLCEEYLNGCIGKPCKNMGVCESHNGEYRCLCSKKTHNGHLYGGENCSIPLVGCDDNPCENGGACSPLLLNEQHAYSCLCLAGFSGPQCQTVTVFSFESPGYMHVEPLLLDPEAPLNVTFSFRTQQPIGTLLQRWVGDLLLAVELAEGRLRLSSVPALGSSTLVLELPEDVADGRWHTVEALLGGVVSLIRLLCSGDSCTTQATPQSQVLERGTAVPEQGSVHNSLTIGAVGSNWGSGRPADKAKYPAAFLGCFQDMLVDSRQLVPLVGSVDMSTQVNVTVGCSDKDKCEDSPCQNRGRCVNQGWRSYRCECHRPYGGPDCTEEYITARFGSKDSKSYAAFSMDDNPGGMVTVSLFIRTRHPSGLLLVLANSTSQYLRFWLEHGRVKVQVHNFHSVLGHAAVNDGHFHLLTVRLEGEIATLLQSSQNQGSVAILPVHVQAGDVVYVGGLTDERASASFGGYFKGCIQDLRINSRRLQFFPIRSAVSSSRQEQLVNVTPGCSSDNACIVNPCLNGGFCYSMWDDFACNCPPYTAGQRCEEVKWCALSPCPASAVCQLVSQGFECVSNVTLGSDSGELSFRGNGKISRRLTSIRFSFRTRQSDGTLIHAEKGPNYLTVSLWDSQLLLELQAGSNEGSSKLSAQSTRRLNNGEWHVAELIMREPELQISPWVLVVDRESVVSSASSGNLDFLREGVDILLGGLGPEAGGNLAGCLGPVEIGGLLLPYYGDAELNLPKPQEEQFVSVSTGLSRAPRYGCWGASVCSSNPCQNQGECEDLFDLSHCKCPPEWTGPLCELSTDTCASGPCSHGNCSVLAEGFQCSCEPGYTGTQCEAEANVCDNNSCALGSTCLRGLQHYACLCPQNMTGPVCDEKIPEFPWYFEMSPLPILPVSICFGSKWNYNCFNGGNCSQLEYTCDCLPGFTGQWCEVDVDECMSAPCLNGGYCRNLFNGFHCMCELNFSGEMCQIDASDFYYYVFLLLWQNMFQLMSYLFMHIDDGPEVDWGFQDD